MSAVPQDERPLEPMREDDLDAVIAIENGLYTHPWTRGNFADSIRAGYDCGLRRDARGALAAYYVLHVAAGEAHLLNLSVARAAQRRGAGSRLLVELIARARAAGARSMFLEVRPSNLPAQGLYARFGFRNVGRRRGYYPAHDGREDALVLALEFA